MNRTILVALCFAAICACSRAPPEVVAYTSVDQVFSEPVFKVSSAALASGVRAVYDTEETKRTGVLNRLIAEGAIERLRAEDVLRTLPALED